MHPRDRAAHRARLTHLQEAKLSDAAFEVPAQAVARTLAMLYPVSQRSFPTAARSDAGRRAPRRRRQHQLRRACANRRLGGGRSAGRSGAQRARTARRSSRSISGYSSESNFYAGLTYDVSIGGVFVSTHQPAAAAAKSRYSSCCRADTPSRRPVSCAGRGARATDAAPGMGVAFTDLKADGSCRHLRVLRLPRTSFPRKRLRLLRAKPDSAR